MPAIKTDKRIVQLQAQIEARDRVIARLTEELEDARGAIVGLAPQPFRRLLGGYDQCRNQSEGYAWIDQVVERVVAATEPLPLNKVRGQRRAPCPLCGAEAQSVVVGNDGYALPDGLRRHLHGLGNASRCEVTAALFKLARASWRKRFARGEGP